MTTNLSSTPGAPPSLGEAGRRNWTWTIIQNFLAPIFNYWLKYRAVGIDRLPEGGALFLINHQSSLDPLLVGFPLRRPVSYLARDSLFRVPVISWILRNTYVMPLSRESAGTESVRKSIDRLQAGYYVGIFPEGTRSLNGEIGRIKPGFIALTRRTEVPIVPIGIAGAIKAYPKGAWWLRPHPVAVVFGEPLSVDEVRRLSTKGCEEEFVTLIRDRLIACTQAAERIVQQREKRTAES